MRNRPLRGEAALAVTPGLRFHGAWLFIEVTDAEREQIKLRAAAIDRALTACTTIGVLAPWLGLSGAGRRRFRPIAGRSGRGNFRPLQGRALKRALRVY